MTRPQTIREWMIKAQKEHWAIGAFNVGNLETLNAIVNAAAKLKSPVLVETSPGETAYLGIDNIVTLVGNARRKERVPIFLNLDHATKERDVLQGLAAGYDYVHFDGGEYWLEENTLITKRLVERAHAKGVLVEAEIDHITGSSKVHTGKAQEQVKAGHLTDPERAQAFVRATGCDTFAAFIGNAHGLYAGGKTLDFKRLKEIRKRTKAYGTFLSLHGGSGVSSTQIKQAIHLGITKININTEMRAAFLAALGSAVRRTDGEVAMYKIMPSVIAAVQKVVEEKIKLFGSRGRI